MMSQKLFESIILGTKIEKLMEERFPKMIGCSFIFDDFETTVDRTGIMFECVNFTCYISFNPNRNEGMKDNRIPINTLKHLYDFLKA